MLYLHLNRPIIFFYIHKIPFFVHAYAANTIVADVLVI